MGEHSERVYLTPRTYGSPTGYDVELSHYPSQEARIAERLAANMVCADGYHALTPVQLAQRVNDLAAALVNGWSVRGWLIAVEPAPDMKQDYGQTRGGATGAA